MSSAPFITDTTGGQIIEAIDRVSSAILNGAVDSTGTTASGNPLSIPDALPADVKSCMVGIEPIQDLHGYDKPWSGGAGKNKLPSPNSVTKSGSFTVENNNGVITINGSIASGDYITVDFDSTTVFSDGLFAIMNSTVLSSANISFHNGGSQLDYFTLTPAKRVITVSSFPNISGKTINRYRINFVQSTTLNNFVISPMLVHSGEDTTSYEPYTNICPISGIDSVAVTVSDGTTPETTTIPLGQTVYGGTLDVKSGVLTVDTGYIASYNGQTLPGAWISDRDVYTGSNSPTTGAQVVYELATPTTIQLSPKSISLLKGQNVITVNGNTVIAVEYHPDIVPYVDRKVDDAVDGVDAMISDNVEGDTASKAYAVNDFMLRPDGFYKVTQPIANGASITSSNTTKTTIGAVLTALLNA